MPRLLQESALEDLGFDTERRAVMEDLEQADDIVRLMVLIDCSGHRRGDSTGRRGWWPRTERTGPGLDKGWGTHTHLPKVFLNPGL